MSIETCFIEAVKELVHQSIEKLKAKYGNDEERIFKELKKEYKNVCEITELK